MVFRAILLLALAMLVFSAVIFGMEADHEQYTFEPTQAPPTANTTQPEIPPGIKLILDSLIQEGHKVAERVCTSKLPPPPEEKNEFFLTALSGSIPAIATLVIGWLVSFGFFWWQRRSERKSEERWEERWEEDRKGWAEEKKSLVAERRLWAERYYAATTTASPSAPVNPVEE